MTQKADPKINRMVQLQCPTCGKRFNPDQSAALPFCSQRCRLIDLGRWLTEEQGLPMTGDEEGDEDRLEPPERSGGDSD